MTDAARARSFANTAELYERARPGYPQTLLDDVFTLVAGSDAPLRIVDLGAGTGKLTRQLTGYGDVVAIEPLAAMRDQFDIAVPGVTCLEGDAEHIPLPDASVDVVTVGQAYHWFDQIRANPEIARVLIPGGLLVALWNTEDETVPWIAALDEIMHRGAPTTTVAHNAFPGWWLRDFRHDPWFTPPQVMRQSWTMSSSHGDVLARMESHSALSVMPAEQRRPVLEEIRSLLAPLGDPVDIPYDTEAYWCTKVLDTTS